MRSYVIDSSALVKLVIPENYSGILRGIITLHYESDVRLIAPEFVLVECANVLWKHTRRNDLLIGPPDALYMRLTGKSVEEVVPAPRLIAGNA